MTDHKSRIEQAIAKFIKKNDPNRVRRKNSSPERDLQQSVIKHLNSNGWSVQNVESKSTFDPRSGRYMGVAAKHGTTDLVGNDPEGRAIFIELKSPGKRSTLRENQRKFLVEKIKSNCFAVVCDSIPLLMASYEKWCLLAVGPERQNYLMSLLPKEKVDKEINWD